eukprot:3117125-Rhodomonas_salina.1
MMGTVPALGQTQTGQHTAEAEEVTTQFTRNKAWMTQQTSSPELGAQSKCCSNSNGTTGSTT